MERRPQHRQHHHNEQDRHGGDRIWCRTPPSRCVPNTHQKVYRPQSPSLSPVHTITTTKQQGFYLFSLQLFVVALVFVEALQRNEGRKFVRVKQEGCHVAWADMGGDHSTIACCSHTDPHDPERWDAGKNEIGRVGLPRNGWLPCHLP